MWRILDSLLYKLWKISKSLIFKFDQHIHKTGVPTVLVCTPCLRCIIALEFLLVLFDITTVLIVLVLVLIHSFAYHIFPYKCPRGDGFSKGGGGGGGGGGGAIITDKKINSRVQRQWAIVDT